VRTVGQTSNWSRGVAGYQIPVLQRHPITTGLFDMNGITQNCVVTVGRGCGQFGNGVEAQSSTSAVAAGRAADAGSEGREGA
jgi:hypothetical protein